MTDKRILMLIEGPDGEGRILGSSAHGLLSLIGEKSYIDAIEITPYGTSIYDLYDDYTSGQYDDLVSYLRYKKILELPDNVLSKNAYNEIYLIFDFDPQYHKYDDEKIIRMQEVFSNETDLGKLYINYPMVEAFYHLKAFPDPEYVARTVPLDGLTSKTYKSLVRKESIIDKHKINTFVYSQIISHNYNKAKIISKGINDDIDYIQILKNEINMKNEYQEIFVLSTLALLPIDYNFEYTMKVLKLKLKEEYLHPIGK